MNSNTLEQLENILRQESDGVEALVATLEQEHEVLSRREGERLEQVVSHKEQQLQQLNELSRQREVLLNEAGYGSDKAGFNAALDADSSGQLSELWHSIETALQKCQYQNQVNGQLLEVSKQQTEELLSLLLGNERSASGGGLYDQSGNTSNSFNQNTSIKV